MSLWNYPLEYRAIVKGLKRLGFVEQKQGATGHIHWVKVGPNGIRKVTVSKHLAPFSHKLIKWMAVQAGVSKREFYKVCRK